MSVRHNRHGASSTRSTPNKARSAAAAAPTTAYGFQSMPTYVPTGAYLDAPTMPLPRGYENPYASAYYPTTASHYAPAPAAFSPYAYPPPSSLPSSYQHHTTASGDRYPAYGAVPRTMAYSGPGSVPNTGGLYDYFGPKIPSRGEYLNSIYADMGASALAAGALAGAYSAYDMATTSSKN